MKIDETQAHICMLAGEVKPGDVVVLYRNDCNRHKTCVRVAVGEGRVSEKLNEHYSIIQVNRGVPLAEGMTVEKR